MVLFDRFKRSLDPVSSCGFLESDQIEWLFHTYEEIEKIWWNNFELIDYPINLVLIGESPLRSENYIYNNDNTTGAAFLYEKHIKDCLARLDKAIPSFGGKNKRPALMNELGLLVLDMFPFAFNSIDTPKFSYKSYYIKKGEAHLKELFLQSEPWHLSEKIEKINSKVNEKTAYAFRYKRNFDLQSKYGLRIFPGVVYKNLGGGHHPSAINEEELYKIFEEQNT